MENAFGTYDRRAGIRASFNATLRPLSEDGNSRQNGMSCSKSSNFPPLLCQLRRCGTRGCALLAAAQFRCLAPPPMPGASPASASGWRRFPSVHPAPSLSFTCASAGALRRRPASPSGTARDSASLPKKATRYHSVFLHLMFCLPLVGGGDRDVADRPLGHVAVSGSRPRLPMMMTLLTDAMNPLFLGARRRRSAAGNHLFHRRRATRPRPRGRPPAPGEAALREASRGGAEERAEELYAGIDPRCRARRFARRRARHQRGSLASRTLGGER